MYRQMSVGTRVSTVYNSDEMTDIGDEERKVRG